MSSGGQVVGGIVGAAAGFVVGGPAGAIYGAQIGMSVGGLLDPPKGPTVEGPRLGDLSVQTSTYGQFIPRTYGTIGLSGNVFWLENNKIREKVRKKKSGGKGGGSSSTVKTYTYFATFAVGLCEGPIAGVRRIWVGPDLVYDAGSDDLETIISSNQASAKFTIYTGTETQQPDPRMQAEMGVASCPAYRGLAYIVFKDLALANYGNSVAGAQVKVEVAGSAIISPKIGYSESDDNVDGQSGLVITGIGGEIATTYKYAGTLLFTDSVRKHRTGGVTDLPISIGAPTGIIFAEPKIATGVDYAFVVSGGDIFTNYGVTSGFPYTTSNSGFSIAKNKYGMIVHYSGGAGSGPIYLNKSGVIFSNLSWAYYAFTAHEDAIYAITSDKIFTLSAEDLTEISSCSFSSAYPLQPGSSFISYFDGKIWILPSNNNTIQSFDAYSGVLIDIITSDQFTPDGSSSSGQPGAIVDGVVYRISGRNSGGNVQAISIYSIIANQVQLSSIFEDEAERSMLIEPADVDASGLADSVTGFKVTATGSIRNAIEPLRGAWPFDVVQSGYKIKATSRGSAPVVTIPVGELAIDTQLAESREMDSQLPQNVTVKYIDRDRDYDANEQRAQRDNTEAVNSLVLELPVVLSATQSAQVADKLIRIYALEKSDFSFTLPAPYRYLEPGDVVTIATTDADYVLRLVSVNQTADGRLECAGRPSSAATYTSIAPGDGGQQGGSGIPLAGATVGVLVDCPVIDEGLQNSPGFAVGFNGYSAGWPGGILYRTADSGQTWDDLQALAGRATAGFASGVLAESSGNLIQRGGSLTVSIIDGTLESVTEAQMLNGANVAAYGVNGRWEIMRFQNATLNGDGTYTLDTFWRGDKGTEWATGMHAINDYFLLMTDPDLAFVGMPTDSIGQPRDYRAITAGADIDSAASASFTYDAVNLETLSGVHPRGVRSAGDLTVTWQRRTRVGGAWRDYVDASLGETSQNYEVDVMDGATVKRTLTATTPGVLYTSAMQVTDFGSPQASVTVNIYQLSAVVGRGYKLEATL